MVEQATEATEELVDAMARLIPQLTGSAVPPTRAELDEVARTQTLLVARVDGQIAGTLTLVVYRVPTGLDARIEDVVVDEGARGHGVGEALTREAIERARAAGAHAIGLTSRPEREAANRLYRRLGFEQRRTNVWRFSLGS